MYTNYVNFWFCQHANISQLWRSKVGFLYSSGEYFLTMYKLGLLLILGTLTETTMDILLLESFTRFSSCLIRGQPISFVN